MNKNLKKVISAASALAVSASGIAAFAATYPDVPNTADYYQAVSELSALGVIAGFEDGTFKPDENVTRAQITKMVVTALGSQVASAAEASAGKDTQFTDVTGSHWAAGYISVGTSSAAQNFINGYSKTTFGPEDNVTYAQAIKMLVAALGYSTSAEGAGGWPSGYLKYGYSLGLTTGLSGIGNDQQLNRAQVAVLIDNALKCPICVSTGKMTYGPNGVAIPEYIPKDGSGDLDGTKDGYQNLLNYSHDAYLVYGRITGTFKSGAGVDADQVRFNVEKSDNWEGYSYKAEDEEDADNVPVYKGQVTNADDYLFTYSEAIIAKDLNDEYTLISITPYGSSERLALNSGDYKQIKATNNSNSDWQLQMYKDSGRNKYDTYKLSSDVEFYVNGREVAGNIEELFNGDYVNGNKVGTVTLIDSPDTAKSSTDGKYDYVMVSYYVDGVVDYVEADTDEVTIALSDCDSRIDRGEIVLDLEDDTFDYHVYLDNAEIEPSDIQEGDVVSVAYDVTASNFKSSDTYDIIVSRNTVEGRVSSIYRDTTNETGVDDEYTLDDGNVYKIAYQDAATLESGVSYTLFLDAFGKVAKVEELASTKKYGLLENVYKTNGGSDGYADVVINTGDKKSYKIKSDDYETFKKILMGDNLAAFDDEDEKLKSRAPMQNRVIEYTITSKEEIRLKSDTNVTPVEFDGEFKPASGKLDGKQLTEALSAIINVSDYEIDSSQSYATVAYDSLKSGTTYGGYAYGRIGSNNVYQFVLIDNGIGGYSVENPWAVYVYSTSVNTDDGDNDAVVALVNGKQETLLTDGSISFDRFNPGDVFFYKTDSDDQIDDIKMVSSSKVSLGTTYNEYFNDAYANNFDVIDATTASEFADEKGPFSSNDLDDCMLISGPIIEASNGSIKIATSADVAEQSMDNFSIDRVEDYSLSSEANIYVYDYATNKARDRVYSTNASSIVKANFDRNTYFSLSDNGDRKYGSKTDGYLDFTNEKDAINVSNENYGNANFAIAKIVDKEITEILVIVPDSDDGE